MKTKLIILTIIISLFGIKGYSETDTNPVLRLTEIDGVEYYSITLINGCKYQIENANGEIRIVEFEKMFEMMDELFEDGEAQHHH